MIFSSFFFCLNLICNEKSLHFVNRLVSPIFTNLSEVNDHLTTKHADVQTNPTTDIIYPLDVRRATCRSCAQASSSCTCTFIQIPSSLIIHTYIILFLSCKYLLNILLFKLSKHIETYISHRYSNNVLCHQTFTVFI